MALLRDDETAKEKEVDLKKQSHDLYIENQKRAKALLSPWSEYYFKVQAHVYTRVPLSLKLDQQLSSLIDDLKEAEKLNQAPEWYKNRSAEDEARYLLTKLKTPQYLEHFWSNLWDLALFFAIAYSTYAGFLFIRLFLASNSLSSALAVGVPISLLAIVLESLLLISMVFFYFQAVQDSSYGQEFNNPNFWMSSAIVIISTIAALFVPFLGLYYHLLVLSFPVWMIWFFSIGLFLYLTLFRRQEIQEEEENDEEELPQQTATISSRAATLWSTFRMMPLNRREQYRKARRLDQQSKAKKEGKK